MEYTLACIWCYYYDDGLEALLNVQALFCIDFTWDNFPLPGV